jgi:hypothetical protein
MASFKNLIQRLVPRVDAWAGQLRSNRTRAARPNRDQLMKSRPTSLDTQYEMVADSEVLDDLFARMRDQILHNDDLIIPNKGTPLRPLREAGRIAPERPYFFIKPFNQHGLLFERSGAGWIVSKAEKIVSGDTFIRSSNVWDHVTVYGPKSGQDGVPRISSERLGLDRVAFPVYTQVLAENLAEQWLESGG